MRHAGPVIVPAVIACRAMFRGREDVYARRYVSAKSGKCGYSPACTVEWTRRVCDKKRVSCAVCPNRRLLPLDDETIRMHLVGHDARQRDFTMGKLQQVVDEIAVALACRQSG